MRGGARPVLALLAGLVLWSPGECQYDTNTKWRLFMKIRLLTSELVKDAEVKISAIQHYRDQYYRSIQYQLGQMLYEMRNKYKRMVLLFKFVDRDVLYGKYDHNANIPVMLEMIQLSMEVENAALMILEWQNRREDKDMFHARMQSVLRSGKELELDRELELIERVRPARGPRPAPQPAPAALRAPPAPPAGKRNNSKWRHVSDRDFF